MVEERVKRTSMLFWVAIPRKIIAIAFGCYVKHLKDFPLFGVGEVRIPCLHKWRKKCVVLSLSFFILRNMAEFESLVFNKFFS